MLGELVAAFGHHPLRAASGAEAIAHAGSASWPDVALIDISLGCEDGRDVARRIRETVGDRPIRLVALTGYSDDATRYSAGEAGFDDYMIKPVLPEALAALLQSTPVVG
jgi:CheY-like chemotaxis protein